MTTSLLGILSALASALSWGGADFSGGYASRRSLPFQVLAASGVISLLVFLCSALIIGEQLPAPLGLAWALLAGIVGAIGLGALYQGLAQGSAAIVSPTAAVLGASIPVVFSALSEGLPRWERLLGICLGVIGIGLVSLTGSGDLQLRRRDLILALLAGTSFAVFFICLSKIPTGSIFYPLAFAKGASILTACMILMAQKSHPTGDRSDTDRCGYPGSGRELGFSFSQAADSIGYGSCAFLDVSGCNGYSGLALYAPTHQ